MPVELLPFPPAYCIVGAYRLLTDPTLHLPIWQRSKKTLKRCAIAFIPYCLIAYPLTRLYVTLILARSPFSPSNVEDAAWLGVSVVKYTTLVLVLGQVSMALEWALSRELKKAKKEVYEMTVRSRGKGEEFWEVYCEEWAVPPIERAKRASQKQAFYTRLASPIVRIVLLKVLLTPLSFIPGLALVVISALRCLTLARSLHNPVSASGKTSLPIANVRQWQYFTSKKMTPFQIELWLTERQTEYRMFGFVASLMERVPLLGLVFGVSNRIGAAMWAHDLEKRQHQFRRGEVARTRNYVSKTAALSQVPSDLPDDAVGAFPTHKGPVRIDKDGSEIGAVIEGDESGQVRFVKGLGSSAGDVPPPLPKR